MIATSGYPERQHKTDMNKIVSGRMKDERALSRLSGYVPSHAKSYDCGHCKGYTEGVCLNKLRHEMYLKTVKVQLGSNCHKQYTSRVETIITNNNNNCFCLYLIANDSFYHAESNLSLIDIIPLVQLILDFPSQAMKITVNFAKGTD